MLYEVITWTVRDIMPEITYQTMSLLKDCNGNIWIGTYDDGLYKYLPQADNKRLIHYHTDNSQIASNIIRNLFEDSRITSYNVCYTKLLRDSFFTVCNYEQVLRDFLWIERIRWDLIILDEGQRIKNWEAKRNNFV